MFTRIRRLFSALAAEILAEPDEDLPPVDPYVLGYAEGLGLTLSKPTLAAPKDADELQIDGYQADLTGWVQR